MCPALYQSVAEKDRIVVAQNETCRDFIPEFWEETYLPCSLLRVRDQNKSVVLLARKRQGELGGRGGGRVAVDELGNQ